MPRLAAPKVDRGQAYAGAFEVFRTVKPLKNAEQLVGVFHVESHAVVTHKHDWGPFAFPLSNLNFGYGTGEGKLQCIRQ